MRRAFAFFGIGLVALVAVLVLGVVFLLQAAPGHRFMLRTAVGLLDARVSGSVRVDEIRSSGLLGGFTLAGVGIHDRGGRPFLVADSVRVGYSLGGLLRRSLVVEPVELWHPRIVIETLPGETVPNVARIFAGDAPPTPRDDTRAPEPARFRLELRGIRVHDGTLAVRMEEAESTFERIQARIRSAVLLAPDAPGERIDFDFLSLDGHIAGLGGPIEIREFRGAMRRAGTRLEVDAEALRLARSRIDGTVVLDWEDGLELHVDAAADPIDTRDLAWLDERIPEASGSFLVLASGPVATGSWRFQSVDVRTNRDRITGRFGVQLGERIRVVDTDVDVEARLSLVEPWLPEPLPGDGRVRASMRVEGLLTDLLVDGTVRLDDPDRGIPASEARIRGRVNMTGASVAGLGVTVNPLRLETLRVFGLEHHGGGFLELEATGGLEDGLDVRASLVHAIAALDVSRLSAEGRVRREGESFRVALSTAFEPLSFSGLERALGVALPVEGQVTGALHFEGPLEDLWVDGEIETPGGLVSVAAAVDATDPARGYRVEGEFPELDLSVFVRAAPDDSRVAGRFRFEGAGFDPATLVADGEVVVDEGSWGAWRIDEGALRADAGDGRFHLRELTVRSTVGTIDGSGDLALDADAEDGEIELHWVLDDVSALRPILLGEEPIDPDTLTAIERDILFFEEIEPTVSVPLRGSAEGRLDLAGGIHRLDARLEARAADLAWRDFEARAVDIAGSTRLVTNEEGMEVEALSFEGRIDETAWGRFAFDEVHVEGGGRLDEIEASLHLVRGATEAYRTSGHLLRDEAGMTWDVNELTLELDPVVWELARPASIRWEEGELHVHELEVVRPGGGEPVRVFVDGSLDMDGPLALAIEATAVDLERLGGILQLETGFTGLLDLDLTLTGTAEAPVADGNLLLRDVVVAGTDLSRVAGTLDYANEQARIRLEVEQNGARLLTATGSYPINLALTEVETRVPNREVDLTIEVDDLPAATALAPLEVIEEVEGLLNGRVEFRGFPRDLRPSGALRLSAGAFALPEVGFAASEVEATFTVNPDGVVDVEGSARSVGLARLSGTIDLSDILDPGFALAIEANDFQAVNRRDLEGRLSGTMELGGRYTEPRVTGSIQVDHANLFLEEFARSAGIVDLTDPAFLAVVDTTLAAARQVARAAQNPFIENLRVDADLSMQRDVWLRSREMNVEIGGDLIVTFDRSNREILLVGAVEAVRGTYNAFGRQFQVRSGTVDFVGNPGINPLLNIEAVHRLRQQGGEPLEIIANLEGTLLAPRISLSSDATMPMSESDLISYLIFGRPSYALASAERGMLGDAAISAGIGAATGQISSLLGQRFGLDYFAITQAQDAGAGFAALSGDALIDTQIELGQYLTDDIFLALVLRPLRGIGGSQAQVPGARVEWRFTDPWTLEAYVEDRFGREGVFTFGDLGLRVQRVFGIEITRDWGY